jgi:hypothetical protein
MPSTYAAFTRLLHVITGFAECRVVGQVGKVLYGVTAEKEDPHLDDLS